jgi:hypothetical protein
MLCRRDVFHFGFLLEVYWVIRDFLAITNNAAYERKTTDPKIPYEEENLNLWCDYEVFRNCWVYDMQTYGTLSMVDKAHQPIEKENRIAKAWDIFYKEGKLPWGLIVEGRDGKILVNPFAV